MGAYPELNVMRGTSNIYMILWNEILPRTEIENVSLDLRFRTALALTLVPRPLEHACVFRAL